MRAYLEVRVDVELDFLAREGAHPRKIMLANLVDAVFESE